MCRKVGQKKEFLEMQITQKCTKLAPYDICGKGLTIRYLMGKLCEFLVLNIFLYSFIYAGFFSQNF
jgi:hypothetical protein